MKNSSHDFHRLPPFKEILKGIPGFFGIRLDEEPLYQVLYSEGPVEIRRYGPMVLAQTTVEGEYNEFSDEAFRNLAGYIFGENAQDESFSMNEPVFQEKAERPLTMTTPVLQEKSASGWTMSFILPQNITLETAPKPLNPRVQLTARPEKLVAVWSYSGNNTPEKIQEAKNELTQWLQDHPAFHPRSHFWWAQYDAPITIPFLKKNEMHIWVEERKRRRVP